VTETKLPALASGGAVAGIVPSTLEDVYRLAKYVTASGLAPYGMDTPEKVTIAIMTGLEVGLPPMQAIQSIAVINGRPTIWGDGLMAVVRQSKDCMWIRESIEGEGDDMVAVCETQRRGETEPVRRTFSVDDAKRAGLWQTKEIVTKRGKNGTNYEGPNDSPWFKYPKRMLQMRARAWCLRDTFADVTKGIQVREEVEDYQGPEKAKDITPQPTTSNLADRFSKPALAARSGFSREHVESETKVDGEAVIDALDARNAKAASEAVEETKGPDQAPTPQEVDKPETEKPAEAAEAFYALSDKGEILKDGDGLLKKAVKAAQGGTKSLETWFNQHDLSVEASMKSVMPQLRKIADRVDTGEA
jgi:hypothetical protein